jgi:hypothetical protein
MLMLLGASAVSKAYSKECVECTCHSSAVVGQLRSGDFQQTGPAGQALATWLTEQLCLPLLMVVTGVVKQMRFACRTLHTVTAVQRPVQMSDALYQSSFIFWESMRRCW